MKESPLSLQVDPFNWLGALTPAVFLCYKSLKPVPLGDRWPGSGLMKQNICATASNSWRSWHQTLSQRKMCRLLLSLLKFFPGRGAREIWPLVWEFLAVSNIPGAILCSKLPSPWKCGQMAIVCGTGWSSKGQASSRDWHPRSPRMWCNTNQVPG